MGVSDDGTPVGIETDHFANEDRMAMHLVNIVKARLTPQVMTDIHVHFENYDDKTGSDPGCRPPAWMTGPVKEAIPQAPDHCTQSRASGAPWRANEAEWSSS